MRKILEGSLIYRWVTLAALFLDRQWQRSRLADLLTARSLAPADGGVSGAVAGGVHSLLSTIYEKLRLERLFAGSILTRPLLWCVLAVALTPVIPTMATLLLVMVSAVSVALRFCRSRDARVIYSPVNKWLFAFGFIYAVCTVISQTPSGSLQHGLLYIALLSVAFLLPNALETRENALRLIWLMVTVGAIVSLGGFYQAIFRVYGAEAWIDAQMFGGVLRVYSTLDNPNVLSEYLLLIVPMGAALALTARGRWARLGAAMATAVMVLCLVLTYSRGGYLGFLAAAFIFLVLLDRRFLLLGVLALALSPAFLPDSIVNRFLSIGDLEDTSTAYRLYIWKESVYMLRDYWLTGIGTGLAPYAKLHKIYGRYTPDAQHAHSLYLQVTCECGAVGLLAMLGLFLSFVRTMSAAIRGNGERETRVMLIAILSGVLGFLVQSLTDYSFYNYRVTLVFWAVMGLGILLARPQGGESDG